MELIIFHGLKINTFQLIVVAAGLKEQQVQLLIESTLQEIELGQMFLYLHKLLLIAKLEEAAMVVTLEEFMLLQRQMVFHKKAVKTIWPKIQHNSAVQQFKNAKIVDIQKDKNQEIKVTVGQLQNTQSGK